MPESSLYERLGGVLGHAFSIAEACWNFHSHRHSRRRVGAVAVGVGSSSSGFPLQRPPHASPLIDIHEGVPPAQLPERVRHGAGAAKGLPHQATRCVRRQVGGLESGRRIEEPNGLRSRQRCRRQHGSAVGINRGDPHRRGRLTEQHEVVRLAETIEPVDEPRTRWNVMWKAQV
jgi:hypothetical protein